MSTRYWEPSDRLLESIRDYHDSETSLGRKLAVLRHRFWSVVTGADIPINSLIGYGLRIPHPTGVVIHPQARIGEECVFMQGITIGERGEGDTGVPTLGFNVEVGAGARILGGITIGAYATIGANAVVLNDVPTGAIVVGSPARMVGYSKRMPPPERMYQPTVRLVGRAL